MAYEGNELFKNIILGIQYVSDFILGLFIFIFCFCSLFIIYFK